MSRLKTNNEIKNANLGECKIKDLPAVSGAISTNSKSIFSITYKAKCLKAMKGKSSIAKKLEVKSKSRNSAAKQRENRSSLLNAGSPTGLLKKTKKNPAKKRMNLSSLLSSESQTAVSKKTKIYCDTCKLQCNSSISYKSHLKGKKHLKKSGGLVENACLNTNLALKTVETQADETNLQEGLTEANPSLQVEDRHNADNFTLEQNMAGNIYDKYQTNYSERSYNYKSQNFHPNRRFFPRGPSWGHYQRQRWSWSDYQYPRNQYKSFVTFPNYRVRPPFSHYQHQFQQPNGRHVELENYCQSEETVDTFSKSEQHESSQKSKDEVREKRKKDFSRCSQTNSKKPLQNDTFLLSKRSNKKDAVQKSSKVSPRLKKLLVRRLSGGSTSLSSKGQDASGDGGVDKQKIEDYTNTLLETHHGQLTRLLHPSNHKDKAAVNHLMTNLSKSKKKETLSRLKLRSDSLCSSGTNDEDECNLSDKVLDQESEILCDKEISSPLHGNVLSLSKNRTLSEVDLKQSKSCSDSVVDKSADAKIVGPLTAGLQNESLADFSGLKRIIEGFPNHKAKKLRFTRGVDFDKHPVDSPDVSSEKVPDIFTCDKDCIKQEVVEATLLDESLLPTPPVSTSQKYDSEKNDCFSADSLVSLFASGSVTAIKNENDPVIELLESIDHLVLMKACSNQCAAGNTLDSRRVCREDEEKAVDSRNCSHPSPRVSATAGQNVHTKCRTEHSPTVDLSTNKSAKTVSCDIDGLETDDVNSVLPKRPECSKQFKNLVTELREISCEEERVKQNLEESNLKIIEYQVLLEEWMKKKEKLQEKEESLRKERLNLIELMQNAVKSTEGKNETDSLPWPSERTGTDSSQSCVRGANPFSNSPFVPSQEENNHLPQSSDLEDIQIMPIKVEEPEVLALDEDDSDPKKNDCQQVNDSASSAASLSRNFFLTVKEKHFKTHSTIVNCLLVFENFLYTCSNDNTAKRFSLENPSETVSYLHSAKNVSEIVVEKVQCEALVLTSCGSARFISLFIASNGTKIRTFVQAHSVMSICKGWGKFYCGLADGTINLYDWRYEEKEIIKSEFPVSRIAATDQGRLHILIVLTSNGHISVRDAETGLLIRYIKSFVKLPSWMVVDSDVAFLSSADKTLTILDIMTGRAEKKLYVSKHTTGLAVYKDYIFTISYSGLINCYNKEKMSEKKLYYGAGKNELTCICVFEDWVLTGNRKGEVSFFHFDPNSYVPCQFGQCCLTFGLLDDLIFHLEKDHLLRRKNLAKCNWSVCKTVFPNEWTMEDKILHMRGHIVNLV